MGILEQITKLKSQGIPDNQIIAIMQEQGFNPKQINDAVNQSHIKNAVSNEQIPQDMDGMNPSMMGANPELQPPMPEKTNNPDEFRDQSEFPPYEEYIPQEPQSPQSDFQQQKFYQAQETYQQPDFQQQQYYPPQENYQAQEFYNQPQDFSSNSTDTMIDVAEQVFDEKIMEIKKQVQETNELKNIAEVRLNNVEKRLDKIESLIDKLQISILDKIGSYGNNLQSIKSEMSMMQDSFGKMINPLKEIAEEVQKPHRYATTPHSNTETHTSLKKSKKK